MNRHLNSVLTTVNAPYRDHLDGPALARCLSDMELAKLLPGHVSAFLGEAPVEDQMGFAAEFGIELNALRALAAGFSKWSGEGYELSS